MIYLLYFFYPYLLGRGALRALYGKNATGDISFADSVLTGGMVLIGLAEAAHLGAVMLGQSFFSCVKLFLAGLLVLLLAAVVLIIVEMHRKKKDKSYARKVEQMRIQKAMNAGTYQMKDRIVFFVFGVMVVLQILLMVTGQRVYPEGDMTVETVNSILATDSIYQVNPLTGQPYELGIPLRLKILCLPTFYAILCHFSGLSAVQVVWNVIPVVVLLGSYLAFYTVAKALFPTEHQKRGIFMVLVALVLWVGDYRYGMDGFAVQYAGFRGVSIRMGVLLPYTFSLILRKKWRLVVLCILAEACIVWTLYGMGACLFATVGMILVGIVKKRIAGNVCLQGGEDER